MLASTFRSAVLACLLVGGAVRAQSLADSDRELLASYLASLQTGLGGSAKMVDELADASFPALVTVMRSYVTLDQANATDQTRLGYHKLLERLSRGAVAPWPLVEMYSPEFARFLTGPAAENKLGRALFGRLLESPLPRVPLELAVRLTPEASLRYLAEGNQPQRLELLAAWNRRLRWGQERRPIPQLDALLTRIAAAFSTDLAPAEMTALLSFIALWPSQRAAYLEALGQCLAATRPEVVETGLKVQRQVPARLDLNEALVAKHAGHAGISRAAIRNFAYDETQDHAAALRRLWGGLKAGQAKERYACLFAMGAHPKGNAKIALAAVKEAPHDFIDVAAAILAVGDPALALEATRHVLQHAEQGHEEALRLAAVLELTGIEEEAIRVLQTSEDQIVKQRALLFLRGAKGQTRRRLLAYLAHPNDDIRLAAIQLYGSSQRLTRADMDVFAPALIRVAQTDESMGHRQEAVFALARWGEPLAASFFRQVLERNPPARLSAGRYSDDKYWQYRFRLMALLGLIRLGDKAALAELTAMHNDGGPPERMDALLAFTELGQAPAFAFADLGAAEPKLIATAAALISQHGDDKARKGLRQYFAERPLWREFIGSGVDDQNILLYAGLRERGEWSGQSGVQRQK